MHFSNTEEVTSARPLSPLQAPVIYFIRAGASKPAGFDELRKNSQQGKFILSLYAAPNWQIPDDCIVIGGGLSKYHALHKIIHLLDFEYIFLLDYDIELESYSEERLIRKLRQLPINCAQFAISKDSHSAFSFFKKESDRDFRRVNFIEVMAPIFSKKGIEKVLHTFPLSISTWGLDYAWSRIFSGNAMYVIDTETMRHAGKPDLIDGPFYKYLESLGINPRNELGQLKKQFDGTRLSVGNVPPIVNGHMYGKVRWTIHYYASRLHLIK